MPTVPSICRHCSALCPILVTVEEGKVVKVIGDPGVELYEGYTCPKGRALPDQHNDPNRLLHCLKKDSQGRFKPIASDTVIDEVTEQVRAILRESGPNAVAMYFGTGIMGNPVGMLLANSWFCAIQSKMVFSASTIDKPGANIATALHGNWAAGGQSFESSDTWMLIGANPVISKTDVIPSNNPGKRLKDAIKRGMKLIVIDPRRNESANRAHVHLQSQPGKDAVLLAGFIKIIIDESLYDREFVETNTRGFEALKEAVSPFSPDYVARHADIEVEQLLEAARTFGGAKRGMAVCATGPSFSTHSNLAFYLTLCLNSICGRWTREGEMAPYPNVLLPPYTPKAQPYSPYPAVGEFQLQGLGIKENASGMPTAALADEILLEGGGRVRALFCLGSNPMLAWPDQEKARAAMEKLDLLVVFDYQMSATAELADYVVASPLSLEVPGATNFVESIKYYGFCRGLNSPWAQYTPKIVDPPQGSDLLEDREFFFRMAQKMDLQLDWINYYGFGLHVESPMQKVLLDMDKMPSGDELIEMWCSQSRIPLKEVKSHSQGHHYEDLRIPVAPRDPDCMGFLQLADPGMIKELDEVYREALSDVDKHSDFPYRLICRRANNYMNSFGQRLTVLNRGKQYNPAFMHPSDIQNLGLESGDKVHICSQHGKISAIITADDNLKTGMVSITHGFGGNDPEDDPATGGSSVNQLISMKEFDPITGIPRMSAVPVEVKPLID